MSEREGEQEKGNKKTISRLTCSTLANADSRAPARNLMASRDDIEGCFQKKRTRQPDAGEREREREQEREQSKDDVEEVNFTDSVEHIRLKIERRRKNQ